MVRLGPKVPDWLRNLLSYIFLAWMIFVGTWVFNLKRFAEELVINQQNRILEEQIYRHISDAESGQRGYLLTGNRSYLEEYYSNIQQLHATHRTLLIFLAKNPEQKQTLDLLGRAISAKLKEMDATVAAYQLHGFEAALAIVQTDDGLVKMRQIQDLLTTLIAQERARARRLSSIL